jgi:hypothetical protein
MPAAHTRTETVPDTLDGSMTRFEIAEVLEHLRFGHFNGKAVIELDRHAAQYLVNAIKPQPRRTA